MNRTPPLKLVGPETEAPTIETATERASRYFLASQQAALESADDFIASLLDMADAALAIADAAALPVGIRERARRLAESLTAEANSLRALRVRA